MLMTAEQLARQGKGYEAVWKMNYLSMHSKATMDDAERAWQEYKASKVSSVSNSKTNDKAEAEFDTNGVSVVL